MTLRVRMIGVLVLPLARALSACGGSFDLAGRAADEWMRSYPLANGGQLQIGNTNSIVEVEGVAGSTVEVRAERVAHATTDSAARALLQQIVIREDISPTRVALDSERSGGLWTPPRTK